MFSSLLEASVRFGLGRADLELAVDWQRSKAHGFRAILVE